MAEALLHLVRHAEPAPSDGAEGDVGLSDRGRTQADALGARLAAVGADVVLHGPLTRALETAQRVAAALPGVPVGPSAHLDDRTPLPADVARVPAAYRGFVASARAAFDAGQVAATIGTHTGRPVLVRDGEPLRLVLVTHAFVVGWFVRHALDAPRWRWMGLNPSHASLTVLRVRDGAPTTLWTFDDLGHLPSACAAG